MLSDDGIGEMDSVGDFVLDYMQSILQHHLHNMYHHHIHPPPYANLVATAFPDEVQQLMESESLP